VTLHRTSSSAETEALGAQLAQTLRPGDAVLISGEVGAGKTTFVRGAAHALGVTGPITSPTFMIGHRHPVAGPFAYVTHIDLYRVASLREEDPDLLADYVGPDVITFVEWPLLAEHELEQLGRVARRVMLTHAGGDQRVVEIQ